MKRIPSGPDIVLAREQNLIGRRIARARREAGLSLAQLSEALSACGVRVTYKAVSKWETGETVPNAYQLMGVCRSLGIDDIFPGAAPALNDIGLRKLADYREDLIASGRYEPHPRGEVEYIDMPVSYLAASAGTGSFLDEGNYEIVSVRRSEVPRGAALGVYVSGDSMEPTYRDGQLVWIARCEELRPGEIGIFAYDGDGYIKEYGERFPPEELIEAFRDSYGVVHRQPVLISHNKKYPPRAVSPEASFQIVGRVLS